MKRLPLLLTALLLLTTASACTMPFGGPTPIPSPIVPAILTPVEPNLTPTEAFSPTPLPPPPTVTPLPPPPTNTPTAAPSATPFSAGVLVTSVPDQETTKVRFPENRTGVTLASTLPANETHTYLVRAQQDQHLIAEIFSPRNDLVLALYSQTGVLIAPEPSAASYDLWRLPANQEYRLQVIGASQASDYQLVINIPRIVRFLAGSYGTIVNGLTGEDQALLYQLRASPGQTMTLELMNVAEGAVTLGVLGLQSGETALATEAGEMAWSGVLPPDNTHYLVQVYGLAEGETRFSLAIDIR